MTPEMQATTRNIQDMTNSIVNIALSTAQQVQQGAQDIQDRSFQQARMCNMNVSPPECHFTPIRTVHPVEDRWSFLTPGNVFVFGLGAVAALGLAYFYMKRGK